MTTAPDDAPASRGDIWQAARLLMGWLVSLVGAPRAILALGRLGEETRAEILVWLRPAEAIARLNLLLEAAALPKPEREREFQAPRELRLARPHERPALDPERPETWRAAFRVMRRERPAAVAALPPSTLLAPDFDPTAFDPRLDPWSLDPRAPNPPCPFAFESRRLTNPWPLALRAEALRRVLDDPAPYAKRLAARLHRRPDAARRIARGPARPPGGPGAEHLGGWAIGQALAQAAPAAGTFEAWDTS